MANPVCMAIHHGLCITAYGAINPCCATVGDFIHINDVEDIRDYFYSHETLEKARKEEFTDNWLEECIGCRDKSEKGLVSRKDKFLAWYPDAGKDFSANNKYAIKHMDISFGNSCNQKCIMCNSNFSSQWLKDDIRMLEESPWIRGNRDSLLLKNWSLSYKHLDQIADLVSKHTDRIEIKGGEPLYDKRFNYFVDAVLEKNPNVLISTNTNGTYFTDKNIKMLNKIKRLNIDVSLDGIGKTFEWIRGYSFNKVEQNFVKALNELDHTLTANYTTMRYNVDHFEEFYNWVGDLSDKTGKKIPIHFTQVVQTPKFIGPAYASKDKIQSGIDQLYNLMSDPRGFANSGIYAKRIAILIDFLKKAKEQDISNEIEKSLKAHMYMAKIRGWNINDYTNV
jgi:molybdenum cofactor biosynthesis enzyme MoaA